MTRWMSSLWKLSYKTCTVYLELSCMCWVNCANGRSQGSSSFASRGHWRLHPGVAALALFGSILPCLGMVVWAGITWVELVPSLWLAELEAVPPAPVLAPPEAPTPPRSAPLPPGDPCPLPLSSHLCMCSRTWTGRLHRIFSISFIHPVVSFGTNWKKVTVL